MKRSLYWRTPAAAVILAASSWIGLAAEAMADPPASRCDKKGAEAAFKLAIEQYGRSLWKEAIPGLRKAANLCPVPNGPWVITVMDFGEYDYVPFFYLGKSHLKLDDTEESFDALRHLYRSRCVNEPERHQEIKEDLSSLTQQCRSRLQSKKRPPQLPHFKDGFAAAKKQDWAGAAEKMWDTLQVWDEDGATTLSSGRWPAPYFPRFRLAEALLQLGCYPEACAQLNRSKLKQAPKDKKEFDLERQRLTELETLCESKKREPATEQEICQKWRCWLQAGGP